MRWIDGSVYVGQWKKGIQHGVGKMIFPDGSIKEGLFDNNTFVHDEQIRMDDYPHNEEPSEYRAREALPSVSKSERNRNFRRVSVHSMKPSYWHNIITSRWNSNTSSKERIGCWREPKSFSECKHYPTKKSMHSKLNSISVNKTSYAKPFYRRVLHFTKPK